jgi:redox-sensitive bicupin YhaK (pirin superfamily)
MIEIRNAEERGRTRISWLDGRHSFSFNRYHDPKWMGFRSLRVINDDLISGGGKFGKHPHEDMEILTWVLDGKLVHEDSTGGRGEIVPGDLQKMTAGTGIFHSEANGSGTETLRLLQIWIEPAKLGLKPYYEQTHYPLEQRLNTLKLVAARDGRNGALAVHQDADVFIGTLDKDTVVEHDIAPGRHGWVQVARGSLRVNGVELKEGDGATISAEARVALKATSPAEVLLFDLA